MKNISVWVTVGLFLIGIIVGFGKLQANVGTNDKDIDKLKNQVETLSISTAKMDTKQEAIKEDISKLDNKIDKILDAVVKGKK